MTLLFWSRVAVVQEITADVPFLALGPMAFGSLTLLVIKSRINLMFGMIVLSGLLSFLGSIIDLISLVVLSNDDLTVSNLASVTAREMLFSASVALRFLFFWVLVALPARGEVWRSFSTTGWAEGSFNLSSDDMHSGSWARWGMIGLFIKYFMLTTVVTVGVLQVIWRVEFTFRASSAITPFTASAILEIVTTIVLALKLLGNLTFVAPELRKMNILDHIPLLSAMAISIGIGIGGLVVARFSEYPIGRFLQALELYILTLYSLIIAFDDVASRNGPAGNPGGKGDCPEEWLGAVQIPAADAPHPDTIGRRSRFINPERPGERLASWVSRRISGRLYSDIARRWVRLDDALRLNSSIAGLTGQPPSEKSESIISYYYERRDVDKAISIGPRYLSRTPMTDPEEGIPVILPVPALVRAAPYKTEFGPPPKYGLPGPTQAPNGVDIAKPPRALLATQDIHQDMKNTTSDPRGNVVPLISNELTPEGTRSASVMSSGDSASSSLSALRQFPAPPSSLTAQAAIETILLPPGSLNKEEVDGLAFELILPRVPQGPQETLSPSTPDAMRQSDASQPWGSLSQILEKEITSFTDNRIAENQNPPSRIVSRYRGISVRSVPPKQPQPQPSTSLRFKEFRVNSNGSFYSVPSLKNDMSCLGPSLPNSPRPLGLPNARRIPALSSTRPVT
ncbi:uncharacterized protein EI90DRAFT_3125548 [Cantharellus anzutake]|uniref:uncharacterized protein n=1 Tax=Cantharellus anzutake TaxID=1750568 RepID=UPI0019088A0F|nr:uncharacterized protein EI90DRAFT_3125548 [Cantharellus anzutake]KAF8328803.1 hypothetical protein EI90DRAFT_3125548 [Cantharellus anzutake]